MVILVEATDLDLWAIRRDAQGTLPQLVRQLVLATATELARVRFRSGEGVQLAGWDGIVVAEKAKVFVPEGISAWELSAARDIANKADSDYERRTPDPGEIKPGQTTFVFVTPRRWPKKDEWQKARWS